MEMTEVKEEAEANTVCRICLLNSDDEMVSIYEPDRLDTSMFLYEKIEKCSGIKVLTDPELPHMLCKKCNTFLSIAHLFRTMCQNSDIYLRKFVCKSTRSIAIDDEDTAEYLVDSGQEDENLQDDTELLQEIDEDNEVIDDATFYYEELNEYTDMLLNDTQESSLDMINPETDDIIIVDHEENDSGELSPSPAKTLDISSDGAAVIRIRAERTMNNEKKNKHICDICGNTYPRKYALEAHMRRHRNERPFECEICHQSFHLNFQLTRHIRKHTGSRPYVCQYCNRNFADRSTMVKHERIHRNERPYACDTCGKCFTYSSVLKVHQMTHTGEKPFICGICKKRFSRSHHLRAHLETLLHQNDPRSKILLTQIKRDEDELRDEQ